MAGRTRLISVPPARGGDDRRGYRQLSGSMGAMTADPGTPVNEGVPAERFEAPLADDAAWQRTIAMREAAEGLPAPPPMMQPAQQWIRPAPHDVPHAAAEAVMRPDVDLTGLPEKFTLEVEAKPGGWWKISAPLHHAGLFIAHQDLLTALVDVPGALAQILRLDGPVPAKPKRKPRS